MNRSPAALPAARGAPRSVAGLVADAERAALRVAAYVRIVIVATLFVMFAVMRPRELPVSFVAVVLISVASYIALAIAGLAVARSDRLRDPGAIVLAVLDVVVYAAFLAVVADALGLAPGVVVIMPPFLLAFLLFALTALHNSIWPAVATVAAMFLCGAALIAGEALQLLPTGGIETVPSDLPLFGARANALRVFIVIAAGVVVIVVAVRARRRLTEAIAITERSANLSRYLPGAIARTVAIDGAGALGRGRIQNAAIVFADIEGFTSLAARTEPEAVGRLLTDIRVIQRRIVETHGGVVDKFMGDAVMAVFGVPEPSPDDARHALAAALAMQEALAAWRDARLARGEAAVGVGIGLHYGPVFAGAIGDEERLEFATLGDTVNVAERVEGLTRTLGASLLVTRAALEAAGADPAAWEALPPQPVKGRDEPVEVLCVRPRRAA